MGCTSCGRGFHGECELGCKDCHPKYEEIAKSIVNIGAGDGKGAPIKDESSLKDRKSTGRKRAAQLYPIFKGRNCEWQGKKNCGGGLSPIVGCMKGTQTDRHHGPVKDPVRNEPGNVHRICSSCHNRWHAKNDPIYNEAEYEKLLHKPEDAEPMELLANEAYWRVKR